MKLFSIALLVLLPFFLNAQRRPNIIVILTDDAGYADFGFQKGNSVETPNINGLQQHGITFSQAYVTAPNCSPSRAGLLTGRMQNRFGHEYNLVNPQPLNGTSQDSLGLPLSQKLMPSYLKELGYSTGIIGKWHEGLAPYYSPLKRGFDYFFGTLEGSSPYFTGKAKEIERNGTPVNPDSLSYLTDALGDDAAAFIGRQTQPFFLYLAFNAPHVPLQAKKEYLDKYLQRYNSMARATNAAMTQSIDDNVGKVLKALTEKNILENTLIIFTNDNGGPLASNGSNNEPLRGAKKMMYEGGIRVPMIIHWPAVIKHTEKSDQVISTLDLLPSFIVAAGGKPNLQYLDGENILPLLYGNKIKKMRTLYWRQGKVGAIRDGDWKLIYFEHNGFQPELYNLVSDVSESNDLFRKHAAVATRLLKKYKQWASSLAKPLWSGGPGDTDVLEMYKVNENLQEKIKGK
ncbi:sulfatase-like hydrolase/transferase [Chitinophaga sp. RAB17]|uniref:sulfatase-like hydrolase/transferase n=1 Tax=Chitinophaga sp. RAB17 TaxID=3233049 RepID=UPI003F8DCABB